MKIETTPANAAMDPQAASLTRHEVAALLQMSVSTLDRMVVNGQIQRVKLGRLVRFTRPAVEVVMGLKNSK